VPVVPGKEVRSAWVSGLADRLKRAVVGGDAKTWHRFPPSELSEPYSSYAVTLITGNFHRYELDHKFSLQILALG